VWSNVVKAQVVPDRDQEKKPNLEFSENLLRLKSYRQYSENEFVTYLKSHGKFPSEKGPYIASSLLEYARIKEDLGAEVFFLP